MVRSARFVLLSAIVLLVACSGEPPRMRVDNARVHAGDQILVRFDGASRAQASWGRRWLTLAPVGAAEDFVGERVLLDGDETEAAVPTATLGHYELRLHDGYPTKPYHVVARVRVDVERPRVARREPPVWYW